jgi:hypothetical protein
MIHCDESAEVSNISEPVARKQHQCCECNAPILKGEKYLVCEMLFDGAWNRYRQHELCARTCEHIRDNIENECICFGSLRDWYREYKRDLRKQKNDPSISKVRSMLAQIIKRERNS